jgi:hypothetical protein
MELQGGTQGPHHPQRVPPGGCPVQPQRAYPDKNFPATSPLLPHSFTHPRINILPIALPDPEPELRRCLTKKKNSWGRPLLLRAMAEKPCLKTLVPLGTLGTDNSQNRSSARRSSNTTAALGSVQVQSPPSKAVNTMSLVDFSWGGRIPSPAT